MKKKLILLSESEMQQKGFYPINEDSKSTIMKHAVNGFIVVSGNKSDIENDNSELSLEKPYQKWLKNQVNPRYLSDDKFAREQFKRSYNNTADENLRREISKHKFSYLPVYGGYKAKDGKTDNYERSFIIFSEDRTGKPINFSELKDFAQYICKRFVQDSVYIQEPKSSGKPPYYMDAKGDVISDMSNSSNNFKFDDYNQMYFTTLKRKKYNANDATSPKSPRFTADINFEDEINEDEINGYETNYNNDIEVDKGIYSISDYESMEMEELPFMIKNYSSIPNRMMRDQYGEIKMPKEAFVYVYVVPEKIPSLMKISGEINRKEIF